MCQEYTVLDGGWYGLVPRYRACGSNGYAYVATQARLPRPPRFLATCSQIGDSFMLDREMCTFSILFSLSRTQGFVRE